MKSTFLMTALVLAVGSPHAAETKSVVEPGSEVLVAQTITPDTGVPVRFVDNQGCLYMGELTKPHDAWLAQVDRKSCPGANGNVVQVVSFVVPLGAMNRAVCAGTRLGMFPQSERLPMGIPKPDVEALAAHAVDAGHACK